MQNKNDFIIIDLYITYSVYLVEKNILFKFVNLYTMYVACHFPDLIYDIRDKIRFGSEIQTYAIIEFQNYNKTYDIPEFNGIKGISILTF